VNQGSIARPRHSAPTSAVPLAVHRSLVPAGVFLAASILLFIPITHDAIWQIWLSRQMLHGTKLYRDIIEVNPPLWFWVGMPLAALGDSLGLSARLLIVAFFIGSICLSLRLAPARFRLLLLILFVLLPLSDFGQREHFTFIASAPYVFAVATRMRGEVPKYPVLIGLFAGLGLCLKPHFLLVPLMLELLVWKCRRLRAETTALAFFTLAYAISIPLFAPDYLSRMVPMIRRYYWAFVQVPHYFAPLAASIIAAGGAWLGRRKGSPESRAALLAALSFMPAVFLQGRGFGYHLIPVRGFLCLAIAIELLESRRDRIGDAMLALSAILFFFPLGVYRNGFRPEMEEHLAGVRPGTTTIVLSVTPPMAWPMVEEHRLDWQLHAFSTWQAGAAVVDKSLLPEVRRIFAPDLAKHPDLLIIDRRPFVGTAARALLPAHYLDCYSLRLRTGRIESYARRC
jgi:hypothetical protein